eukprot:TRINITY_DN13784_c0_g1_i1.p1 TRINITY_DN13784_c0_g1~~TRINITY_DN13784_c0_g1_i1.p1  ORF type:complete len:166 (-),score=43.51 TRINITY_DN13784_c0_g1_i1:42-539(-)
MKRAASKLNWKETTKEERAQFLANIPETQLQVYKEYFSLFDKDGSGVIDKEELRHVFKAVGQSPSTEALQRMIEEVDIDGNGVIAFDEFALLMAKTTTQEEIRETFKALDPENKGYIDLAELRYVLTHTGDKLTDEEIDELLEATGIQNGNAKVKYEELIASLLY